MRVISGGVQELITWRWLPLAVFRPLRVGGSQKSGKGVALLNMSRGASASDMQKDMQVGPCETA